MTERSVTGIGLALHQALDGLVELPDLLGRLARADRLGYAVLGVIGEQLEGDALEGGPCGIYLGQDVDAVAVVIQHLLDTSDLAFDPSEPGLDAVLILRVTWHIGHYTPYWYDGSMTPATVVLHT